MNHKAHGGEKEHYADKNLERVCGQVEIAAYKGRGDGEQGERPKELPGEMPCPPELPGTDGGHQDIKDKGRRFDLSGCHVEKRHDGDVSGCAGVACRRV